MLLDAFAQLFATRSPLLDDRKVSLAGFVPIGSGFPFQLGFGIQKVNDLLAELAGFIDQAEVGWIPDRLFDNRRIQNQFALVGRRGFCAGTLGSG